MQSAQAMVESAGTDGQQRVRDQVQPGQKPYQGSRPDQAQELLRKVRSINARERDDIIRHLVDGGWIEEVQIKSKGRTARGWRWEKT